MPAPSSHGPGGDCGALGRGLPSPRPSPTLGLEPQGPGRYSPQPGVQVAPEPPHHLAAFPLGYEGCGAERQGWGGSGSGGMAAAPLGDAHTAPHQALHPPAPLRDSAPLGFAPAKERAWFIPLVPGPPPLPPSTRTEPAGGWQDWKGEGRPSQGGHSPARPARQSAARASRARTVAGLMAGLSCLWLSVRSCRGCCWTSAGRSASHGRQRGLYPGCAAGEGGPTVSWAGHGGSARTVWELSTPALRAKPQRMLWLEPELPGQARCPCRVHPKPPAPAQCGAGQEGREGSLRRKGGSRSKIESGRAGLPLEGCDLHCRPQGQEPNPREGGVRGSEALYTLDALDALVHPEALRPCGTSVAGPVQGQLGLCVRTGNPKPAEVGHQMKTALLSGAVGSLSPVPPQGERQGPWEAGRGACLCS